MFDTPGHLETIEKRIEMRIRAEMLEVWEELWRAIKKMEPGLGDANKPLAIAASYALLMKEKDDLKRELAHSSSAVMVSLERALNDDAEITELKLKLASVVMWLEANQPDVFRRGLWDAVVTGRREGEPRFGDVVSGETSV
jgi:hypothetical protein